MHICSLAGPLANAFAGLFPQMSRDKAFLDHRIEKTEDDTDYYNIDEEFPWTEAKHYELWSEFYKSMDKDALMNLDNYLDR